MNMPLYLTADEKKLFASLKTDITSCWQIEEEVMNFKDSDQRKKMRFDLLRLHDPILQKTRERIAAAQSDQEFQDVLKTLDFSQIGNQDFSRLLYALGPEALGMMIQDILNNAASISDMEVIAALAGLRHLMLEALIEADF